jgi:prepilin-type N-terminal cleavage/methylation domain-containing protein
MKKGFTLLEILLVIAMITIIVGIFSPVFTRLFYRNTLDLAAEDIKTDLYRAKTLARSSENNSNWGVYLTNSSSIIFSGSSYAARNTVFDEIQGLKGELIISGLNEIVFQKNNGQTLNSGTINLTLKGDTKNIIINPYGLIY